MDVRKHMLAYFERTISHNQPPKDLKPASELSKPAKASNSKPRSSPTQHNYSGSFSCKSEQVHRSISSKVSSNRSSRISSPAPQGKSSSGIFKEAVMKTINELIKLRKLKITKHLEMVAKELKLVKKLKVLVCDEIILCRKQEERRVVQDVNERLSVIMKESAEELLEIEQKVRAVVDENLALQATMGKIVSWKGRQAGFDLTVQECLNDLADKASDVSTMLVNEPVIVQDYLSNISHLAEGLIQDLGFKDFKSLPGVLALYLSREKMLFEQRKKQNQEELTRVVKSKQKLQKLLSSCKDIEKC